MKVCKLSRQRDKSISSPTSLNGYGILPRHLLHKVISEASGWLGVSIGKWLGQNPQPCRSDPGTYAVSLHFAASRWFTASYCPVLCPQPESMSLDRHPLDLLPRSKWHSFILTTDLPHLLRDLQHWLKYLVINRVDKPPLDARKLNVPLCEFQNTFLLLLSLLAPQFFCLKYKTREESLGQI